MANAREALRAGAAALAANQDQRGAEQLRKLAHGLGRFEEGALRFLADAGVRVGPGNASSTRERESRARERPAQRGAVSSSSSSRGNNGRIDRVKIVSRSSSARDQPARPGGVIPGAEAGSRGAGVHGVFATKVARWHDKQRAVEERAHGAYLQRKAKREAAESARQAAVEAGSGLAMARALPWTPVTTPDLTVTGVTATSFLSACTGSEKKEACAGSSQEKKSEESMHGGTLLPIPPRRTFAEVLKGRKREDGRKPTEAKEEQGKEAEEEAGGTATTKTCGTPSPKPTSAVSPMPFLTGEPHTLGTGGSDASLDSQEYGPLAETELWNYVEAELRRGEERMDVL